MLEVSELLSGTEASCLSLHRTPGAGLIKNKAIDHPKTHNVHEYYEITWHDMDNEAAEYLQRFKKAQLRKMKKARKHKHIVSPATN